MSNRQLHNLTPISNSIDSADLFVVVDKSKLTTNRVSLKELSDSFDDVLFLSSSYSLTSSFTTGTTISTSFSQNVTTSLYTSQASGSAVIATSSSYSITSSICYTNNDLFEITSSDDTLGIYTVSNSSGMISIKPRAPFSNSYILKPKSHSDTIGSRIISSTSGVIIYIGLSARLYQFEVCKLDSNERSLNFGIEIPYRESGSIRYSEFRYFSEGGAQSASGSNVLAISSSQATISSSYSQKSNIVISSSSTNFADNCTGSGIFSISASFSGLSTSSLYSEISLESSNGPLPGMILLYAGVSTSGSSNWYNCDGNSYDTTYTVLSSSLQSKFTDGVTSNRLPNLSSNSGSRSGPYNRQVFVTNLTQSVLGHPNNSQVSQSYGIGGNITGSYSTGIISGSQIGSPRAFYYNIKR